MDNQEQQLEDCIFIANHEENCIITSCLICYQEKLDNQGGMFWNGSIKGYGPWEIKCKYCDKIINKGSNADK